MGIFGNTCCPDGSARERIARFRGLHLGGRHICLFDCVDSVFSCCHASPKDFASSIENPSLGFVGGGRGCGTPRTCRVCVGAGGEDIPGGSSDLVDTRGDDGLAPDSCATLTEVIAVFFAGRLSAADWSDGVQEPIGGVDYGDRLVSLLPISAEDSFLFYKYCGRNVVLDVFNFSQPVFFAGDSAGCFFCAVCAGRSGGGNRRADFD